MKTIDDETEQYLKDAIETEIIRLADDVSVLSDSEDTGGDHVKYLNDRINFANKNGVDFWKVVKETCTSFEYNRLQIYYTHPDLKVAQVLSH